VADAGAILVFDGSTGELIRSIDNPDPQPNANFGQSIAVVGDLIAVGAPRAAGGVGRVYVLEAKTGRWFRTLGTSLPESVGPFFGFSIAAWNGRLAVGAPLKNLGGVGPDAGGVYVFDPATGEELFVIDNPEPDGNDSFGASVAALDDEILIGAPSNHGPDDQLAGGSVYIYRDPENRPWRIDNPRPMSEQFGQFGDSIAVRGNQVVISAPMDDAEGFFAGRAYLWDSTNRLPAEGTEPTAVRIDSDILTPIRSPVPTILGQFATSVAWVGERILIGATRDVAGGASPGAAYVFDVAVGTAGERHRFVSGHAADEFFGQTVAALDQHIVVAAPQSDRNGPDSGAVHIVEGLELSNVAVLSGLELLRWFSATGQQIADVSPLANLTNLEFIHLRDNRIARMDGVAGDWLIDDGDAGYSDSAGWLGNRRPVADAVDGDYRYLPALLQPAAPAVWEFVDLDAGTYEIWATWPEDESRATTANYSAVEV